MAAKGTTSITAKQRRELFAFEWLKDRNATAAYGRAGYKGEGHAAAVEGSKLLRHPEVVAIIDAEQVRTLRRARLDRDDLLDHLEAIIDFDIADLFDEHGAMINPKKLPKRVRAALASVELSSRPNQGAVSTRLKPHDKLIAIQQLAKAQKFFEETPPPPTASAALSIPVADLANMDDAQLDRAIDRVNKMIAGVSRGAVTP